MVQVKGSFVSAVKFKRLFVALIHPVAMKASPTVTTRYSLRFVALFLMWCVILVHFSATNEIQLEQSEREQIVDQVFDDGAKIGDGEKRTLLHRQRKSAKNNVMVSLSEVQKRLRVIEER